jgi:tryptophan synthase alpha chain
MSRIANCFAALRRENRAAFIPFVTGGDPDLETSLAIVTRLADAGADIIELGVPFSDPMADGPAVQASSVRALRAGTTLPKVLALVRAFRERHAKTPIVLMGYYNPIHAYGPDRFVADAAAAGVDGLIVVDLPMEEDGPLRRKAAGVGIDLVRLIAPTTDDRRLKTLVAGASGFLYYVSIAGITGTKNFDPADVGQALARIRRQTDIPCAVGFGIKTPEQAAVIARLADAAVVGSSIVNRIAIGLADGSAKAALVEDVISFSTSLANSVHAARTASVVQ